MEDRLDVGTNGVDILKEWKWNKGHLNLILLIRGIKKEDAQRKFIIEAERLGIPHVDWERASISSDTTKSETSTWPSDRGLRSPPPTVSGKRPTQWFSESRRLNSRDDTSDLSSASTKSGDLKSHQAEQGAIALGSLYLSLLFDLMTLSWVAICAWSNFQEGPRNRRLHAREWSKME
jgi:hypothetical protein